MCAFWHHLSRSSRKARSTHVVTFLDLSLFTRHRGFAAPLPSVKALIFRPRGRFVAVFGRFVAFFLIFIVMGLGGRVVVCHDFSIA